jgi:hypothetical protein
LSSKIQKIHGSTIRTIWLPRFSPWKQTWTIIRNAEERCCIHVVEIEKVRHKLSVFLKGLIVPIFHLRWISCFDVDLNHVVISCINITLIPCYNNKIQPIRKLDSRCIFFHGCNFDDIALYHFLQCLLLPFVSMAVSNKYILFSNLFDSNITVIQSCQPIYSLFWWQARLWS